MRVQAATRQGTRTRHASKQSTQDRARAPGHPARTIGLLCFDSTAPADEDEDEDKDDDDEEAEAAGESSAGMHLGQKAVGGCVHNHAAGRGAVAAFTPPLMSYVTTEKQLDRMNAKKGGLKIRGVDSWLDSSVTLVELLQWRHTALGPCRQA